MFDWSHHRGQTCVNVLQPTTLRLFYQSLMQSPLNSDRDEDVLIDFSLKLATASSFSSCRRIWHGLADIGVEVSIKKILSSTSAYMSN